MISKHYKQDILQTFQTRYPYKGCHLLSELRRRNWNIMLLTRCVWRPTVFGVVLLTQCVWRPTVFGVVLLTRCVWRPTVFGVVLLTRCVWPPYSVWSGPPHPVCLTTLLYLEWSSSPGVSDHPTVFEVVLLTQCVWPPYSVWSGPPHHNKNHSMKHYHCYTFKPLFEFSIV